MFFKYEANIAFFFTIGLIATFFYLGTVHYAVNDDMAITALVKGLFGLAPSAEGVFLSPLLSGLLFLLYKLFPYASWFSLFLYTGVALACFLGCLTILMTIHDLGGKIAGLLGVAFFISFTVFKVNFATVSLLLWITGCAFLLLAVRRRMSQNVWFWLASAQLAAAYLLRPSLLLIFILMAVPLFLALLLGGERRVAWYAFAPLLAVLILGLLSSLASRGGDAYADYQEFNKIRGEFNDTHRARRTPETPQALFAAQWSNEDYLVSANWWLHDSTFFNADQIRTFLDKNASKSSTFNIAAVKQNFSDHLSYLTVILCWILVLLLVNNQQIKKTRTVDLLLYVFLIAVVLLLMGVRFPPRVAFPCFLMLFLNSWIIFDDFQESNGGLLSLKITIPLLFIIFLTYSFVPVISREIEQVENIKETKEYVDQSLVGVLQRNGHDSIIVDVTPHKLPHNCLPFQENEPILKTRIMPGGWLVGSPAYLDFLQREGLGDRSTAVAAMIDNRRIVFRYWDSRDLPFEKYLRNIFLPHLRQRYTVPGSDRYINLKILKDDRQGNNGLIYFQLVTLSVVLP